jgi:hypothetical protein
LAYFPLGGQLFGKNSEEYYVIINGHINKKIKMHHLNMRKEVCNGCGINRKTGKLISFRIYRHLSEQAMEKLKENVAVSFIRDPISGKMLLFPGVVCSSRGSDGGRHIKPKSSRSNEHDGNYWRRQRLLSDEHVRKSESDDPET